MSLEMLDDRIAIIPLEDPDIIGSIYIPTVGHQRIDQGIVKYRGPNTTHVFIGAHVLFSGYDGSKVSIEGEGVFFVMREDDIQAIINDRSEPLVPITNISGLAQAALDECLKRIETDKGRELANSIIGGYLEVFDSKVKDYVFAEGFEF